MVNVLYQNFNQEDLSRKILNFVHNSMRVMGPDVIPLISEVAGKVSQELTYVRQHDVMRLGTLAVDSYKQGAMPVIQASLANTLQKATLTEIPTKIISDDDRTVTHVNSELVKSIYTYLDRLGHFFSLDATILQILDPLVEWLQK